MTAITCSLLTRHLMGMYAPLAALVIGCSEPAGAASDDVDGSFASRGAIIAYSVQVPPGDGPFPAVVLVHGSGPITRAMQKALVDRFASMGFAVLSYDKRGTGLSTGTYSGVGPLNSDTLIRLLAEDAAGAVQALAAHRRVDRARVGLAGGSQAGWVIPLAAELSDGRTRFAINLVGPTVTVGEEMFYSALVENGTQSVAAGHAALPSFSGPHGFDPMPWVRRMRIRTLWLYGAEDRSIPSAACVERFATLGSDVRPWHSVRVYPDLGHSLSSAIWADVREWLAPVLGS